MNPWIKGDIADIYNLYHTNYSYIQNKFASYDDPYFSVIYENLLQNFLQTYNNIQMNQNMIFTIIDETIKCQHLEVNNNKNFEKNLLKIPLELLQEKSIKAYESENQESNQLRAIPHLRINNHCSYSNFSNKETSKEFLGFKDIEDIANISKEKIKGFKVKIII